MHYPWVSTDMLSRVRSRTAMYNNDSQLSRTALGAQIKVRVISSPFFSRNRFRVGRGEAMYINESQLSRTAHGSQIKVGSLGEAMTLTDLLMTRPTTDRCPSLAPPLSPRTTCTAC